MWQESNERLEGSVSKRGIAHVRKGKFVGSTKLKEGEGELKGALWSRDSAKALGRTSGRGWESEKAVYWEMSLPSEPLNRPAKWRRKESWDTWQLIDYKAHLCMLYRFITCLCKKRRIGGSVFLPMFADFFFPHKRSGAWRWEKRGIKWEMILTLCSSWGYCIWVLMQLCASERRGS